MQFIPKTEVKHLQVSGVRCSELWCFTIYWKTASSTVEKMLRNCIGDWLTKLLLFVEIFCKNNTENHRMEKGKGSLLESAWVHEWEESGTEGLLKTCRALQSVLHRSWENCHILGNPSVLLMEWNLGNTLSRASFLNANRNQGFCWNKAQLQPGNTY